MDKIERFFANNYEIMIVLAIVIFIAEMLNKRQRKIQEIALKQQTTGLQYHEDAVKRQELMIQRQLDTLETLKRIELLINKAVNK